MITTPTCLVLGAGASAPYGFPLGITLRNQIARLARTRYQVIEDAGFSEAEVRDFATRLSRSGYTSVDWFLRDFPEYLAVGKAAIAAHIIPQERDVDLWPPNIGERSWYEYLLNVLDSGEQPFSDNRLSVITFNYDRSFEHYLFTALSNRRGDETIAVADFLSVEVVHVHGSLGDYPVPGRPGTPYHEVETAEAVVAAADRIVILSEADADTADFIRARELLDGAERIIFLGFGYHAESLRRLGPWTEEARGGVFVTGTHYEMPGREWGPKRDSFDGLFRDVGSRDAYGFLSEMIELSD